MQFFQVVSEYLSQLLALAEGQRLAPAVGFVSKIEKLVLVRLSLLCDSCISDCCLANLDNASEERMFYATEHALIKTKFVRKQPRSD